MITAELLRQFMPYAGKNADLYAVHLEQARARFVGNGWHHVAMWLAQIAHESGSLKYVRELAAGDAYEGRLDLGNVFAGDGRKFRGRGLLQVTGRKNYRQCGFELGLRLEDQPELLEEPHWAAMSAGWVWKDHDLARLCSEPDPVLAVTKRLNGGTNGLQDRREHYQNAMVALKLMSKEPQLAPIVPKEEAPPAKEEPPAQEPPKTFADRLREQSARDSGFDFLSPDERPFQPLPQDTSPPPAPAPKPAGAAPSYVQATRSAMNLPPMILKGLLDTAVQAIPEIGKLVFDSNKQPRAEVATAVLGKIIEATRPVSASIWQEQQAVTAIAQNPALAQQARAAIVSDYDRLMGMVIRYQQADDDSRDRAAERATKDRYDLLPFLADRGFKALAAAFFAQMALILIGYGVNLTAQLNGVQTLSVPTEALMILLTMFVATGTKLIDRWGQLYDYRIGSSDGSKASGDALRAIAQRQQH